LSDERTESLLNALRSGDEAVALQLLDENPSFLDSTIGGVSPIRAAIYAGNGELARKIAERTPMLSLHDAAALGRAEQIKHLEGEANALSEDGFTPLTLAAAFGNAETVAALVLMGASLEMFSTNPNIKVAPIHAAAFGGNAGAIEVLINAGANPNLVSEGGFTALHSAAQNGDEASVAVLLKSGADKSLRTDEGKTAADYARDGGHADLAELLEPEAN
jgi:ankyrin repeat protein